MIQRSMSVRNTGGKAAALVSISPLAGGVQQVSASANRVDISKELYRIGYMKGSVWGSEGAFHWEDLPDEIYTIAGRYRRDRYRHPMFALENLRTGETFICQLAWTGGYAFSFDLNKEQPSKAQLSYDIALDAPAPMRILRRGKRMKARPFTSALCSAGWTRPSSKCTTISVKAYFKSRPAVSAAGWKRVSGRNMTWIGIPP